MKLQPEIIKLLNKKGITSEKDIEEFFSDKPQKTYDPFLLLNMEAGVDLVLSAIENEEEICIYGDYDTDGITSTSVLLDVLSNLTDKLSYHLPSRFKEGYGLNCQALKEIKERGAGLVITVDCGSTSVKEVEYANQIGLKILVTDHHTVGDVKPDCLIINPKQKECPYPFKNLAGVGVAFKLAQAIAAETGLPKSVINRTLDLVGIGTIGDIVPLVDENRTLAKYGLRTVHIGNRMGLNMLIEGTGLKKENVNSGNVSFVIVPHLNAAGRLEDASYGVELLRATDRDRASELVAKLVELNSRRKSLQEETFAECKELIAEKYSEDPFILVELKEAHEGITGIVAGKIKEEFYQPAVIVTPVGEGMYKGTGRSVDGLNLYDMLNESAELFEKFGGHKAACGFTIKKENIDRLRNNLNSSLKCRLEEDPEILKENIQADIETSLDSIDLELVRTIEKFEPFGCENPRPLVGLRGTCNFVKNIGKEGQYRRFSVKDGGAQVSSVLFKSVDKYDQALRDNRMHKFTGELEENHYEGRTYLNFRVDKIE